MIFLFVTKYRKKIATALLLLLFIQIVGPAIAADTISAIKYNSDRISNGYIPFFEQGELHLAKTNSPIQNIIVDENEKKHHKAISDVDSHKAPLDIDGPGQPEMKSFQSVNSDNMVDLFTGDFSYSIPLLDVGGYPVNLHYNSGITMDQEASWVGLGWNINPGSISRSMRGLPDDFDGINDSLTKTQHVKPNRTVGVTISPSLEIAGMPVHVSATLGIFHNTYNGYGLETGVGIGGTAKTAFGSLTGGLSISNNSQEGINVNPSLDAKFGSEEAGDHVRGSLGISTGYSSRTGISSIQINGGIQGDNFDSQKGIIGALQAGRPTAVISFANRAYTPKIRMPITNKAYSFTAKVGTMFGAHDLSASFTGYVNSQFIADEDVTQKIPAAGYIYSINGNGRENILLDYNREKDLNFDYKTTPHIAIPQYTYDAFSISAEGNGGSFRAYRGDVGYMFDHSISSRSDSKSGSIDIGDGGILHAGLEVTDITMNSANHRWNKNNNIESRLSFQAADTTYESVYFRNPGEKTINAKEYYKAIGNDSLIRVKLSGSKDHVFAESAFVKYNDEGRKDGEIPVSQTLVKRERDKRTQVISYLNAEDASVVGLDKKIRSYSLNDTFPGQDCNIRYTEISRVGGIRKKNHLSEISVLNSDGRKYVYGLPIYNALQRDVSFAVGTSNVSNRGLVQYAKDTDNTVHNIQGKDGAFSKEEIPGYAHNFLLTGIVSPDYVDITGDGISEDDPGDAVRFNYTEVYGGPAGGYFRWRTPFQQDSANYNEGLKTNQEDNKASYLYGEKEMWYLHTIESKTMVAIFHIKKDRLDAFGVVDENGAINSSQSAYRLDHINLFVKADVLKNGSKARPVKTVHFSYNYELCKGAQGDNNVGKLTLKSVWFTYNKNNKGKLNPYKFQYHPDDDGNPQSAYNPYFNSSSSDRWGTYKNKSDNPDGMVNADYPYTTQSPIAANKNASMWALTDIILPSGGKMQVTYESDDYAYVQDKRATQMTTISGIETVSANKLYNNGTEFYKIYITTPDAIASKAELKSKYLDVDDVLYYKLAVNIPKTPNNNNIEMIPGYGTIADYGIDPTDNKKFWIQLAPVEKGSPLVRSAIQFLRLNLPDKAYPNSENIDNISLDNVIKMLATSFSEIKNVILGFNESVKSRKWCQTINLARSFVRLSSPDYKKLGGGYRVKRIAIYDNWHAMTERKESVYGQEYNYTTTENVNGTDKIISSGVATYEPAIGGEENPFRKPINYIEKVAPMAPVDFMFSEEPLGESFFPSPMVGYGKVRVRTINAKARSANGWAETEFFTSHDFPTKVEHTLLEEGDSKFRYEVQSNIVRLNHKNYVTLSQGFKVELNDMNGKLKGQASYAETDSTMPISYTRNFYKVDDDKAIPKHLNNEVWAIDSTSGIIDTHAQIGKDIEVMADLREQTGSGHTIGFSPNLDLISPFAPPIVPVLPLITKLRLPQKEEVRYRSSAIVKIIQRYGILDSVVVMDKGSVVSTKNMVYDAGTGNVVLSRTNNEFNDPVYNFNYPAYWAYSGMGQAYKNISAIFQGTNLQLTRGLLYQNVTERYPVEHFFESGDEVYVSKAKLGNINSTDCRFLDPTTQNWSGRLWVIDAQKGLNKDVGLYFIDSLGKPARNMTVQKMMIIRSGKRNMSDVSAGNVVMLKNPVKLLLDGRYQIAIDSNAEVLNASAATFKDIWKVENTEYKEDSCYTLFKTGQIDTVMSAPATIFRRYYQHYNYNHITEVPAIQSSNFVASSFRKQTKGNHFDQFNLRSVIKFDLSTISQKPNVTVTGAVLNLKAQAPRAAWSDDHNVNLTYFQSKTKAHYQFGPGLDDHPGTWTNESVIRRVLNDVPLSTRFIDVMVTDVGKVTVPAATNETCVDRALTVTSIVSSMVTSPADNHGFALDLKDWSTDNASITESNSSERTQSYCSGIPYTRKEGGELSKNVDPGDCIDCIGASLYVTYSFSKDTCVKVCRKNIVDSATNPYRWGILGNWRMERSYVYYNARKESDASEKNSNIRVEGLLKDFVPYWGFNAERLLPSQDSSRWVWNSAIETFNRKGFEIENYDALGRYNAGLYGYNQTLPIAVAQNSRYRELLSDGFEDYGYSTNNCDTCKPRREFDFVKGNTGVDTTQAQSHTGLYSVHVNSGSDALLRAAVDKDTLLPVNLKLYADIDSSQVNTITIPGAGTGLRGDYFLGNSACRNTNQLTFTRTDPTVNFIWGTTPGTPGAVCRNSYSVNWTGTVQAKYTGPHTFYIRYSGTLSFSINGVSYYRTTNPTTTEIATRTVNLQAGQLYSISINYTKTSSRQDGEMILSWSSPAQPKEVIPMNFLYPASPASADTSGSINYALHHYCITADTVQAKNAIRGKFSPLTNTKLTVSAWVRLDVDDCNATPALDSVIQVNFKTATNATWLKKTGMRIEGWQRYEATMDMPSAADTLYLHLKTLASKAIFVDDIRVQPFNSAMKSYVYSPINLRLMAELDENNYASFYEYDDDGTLIRVKKETERGIMTIQETRSALFKE